MTTRHEVIIECRRNTNIYKNSLYNCDRDIMIFRVGKGFQFRLIEARGRVINSPSVYTVDSLHRSFL